jgi:hypothetical protein
MELPREPQGSAGAGTFAEVRLGLFLWPLNGKPPRKVFMVNLEECLAEWRRRRSGVAELQENSSGAGRPQSALPSLCYQERLYCRSYSNFQPLVSLSADGPALFNPTC